MLFRRLHILHYLCVYPSSIDAHTNCRYACDSREFVAFVERTQIPYISQFTVTMRPVRACVCVAVAIIVILQPHIATRMQPRRQ